MKSLQFLLIPLFLFCGACNINGRQADEVLLFNDYRMKLLPGEQVKELDAAHRKVYERYCNNTGKVQVPLFKMFVHKDYTLFAGLPFHSSLEQLAQARTATPADTVFSNVLSDTSFYRQSMRDSLYLTEYVYRPDSSMLICIFAVSKSLDPVPGSNLLQQRIFK